MTSAESILRRSARTLSLLFAVGLAIAAPYLLPANPDSAVFRSGTLSLILLCALTMPIAHALRTKPLRSLAFGFVFALLFSLCLGLGSELTAYDGLLPGMGSLIRRLFVPMLATPALGSLAAYLFADTFSVSVPPHRGMPFWVFFLLFALCYGAVLLALYPGVIAYDFEHEIRQFTTGVYEAAHPIFHTLFLGGLYALGETLFGSMTAGAALYSAVQLLLLSAMYAYACTFVQRRVPRVVTLMLAACFALLPVHSVLAVSTAKDPLFAGLCVLLCLSLWELVEDSRAFFARRLPAVRFALICLLMSLLRHNAPFAVISACIVLFCFTRGQRRAALMLSAVTLLASFLVPNALEAAVGAQKTPSSELMSVPCQQLMRTASRANLSEAEYEELDAWFTGQTARYRPHCADPAKGGNFDFERYQADPNAFLETYLRYGQKYPRIYFEAFLENCAGLWNPDDVSHAHAMVGEQYEFVYLITDYNYEPDRYDIKKQSYFPALYRVLFDFTHHAAQEKYPLLAELMRPSFAVFVLLYITLLLRYRRRRAMVTLPLWGLTLSIAFSAGVFVRYAYPLMAAVPVLLVLVLFHAVDTQRN